MSQTKDIQSALIAKGYSVGKAGADGIMGRDTIAAIAEFQKEQNLDIRWPGTIGPKTLVALGLARDAKLHPNGIGGSDPIPTSHPAVEMPWISEARRYYGMNEKRDAKVLDKALRLSAKDIPWCGAFVGMCISATLPNERLPANMLGARNWLKAGRQLSEPKVGAIAVFWRGSKDGWSGHVGFVVGHDKTHLHILGGNQSDSVTVSRIAKNRLLGYRWPETGADPDPRKLQMTTIQASVTENEA